jgi:signal transduction histidine kinase
VAVNTLSADPLMMALHELRSPLALIATAARSAAEDCSDDALRQRCDVIVRSAERTLRTAKDLLSLARGCDRGESYFDADLVVEGVAADLSDLGARIRLDRSALEGPAMVFGSAGHFETLLMSCLNNALDHSPPGGDIEVGLSLSNSALQIRISNDRRHTPHHVGLGLGTYIADVLARLVPAEIRRLVDGDSYVLTLSIPLP